MSSNATSKITLAVIGGTGKEGSGLALRWANAGYDVIIGSRESSKAENAAAEINQQLGQNSVRGMENRQAAAQASMIVLTVPYSAHRSTLETIHEAAQGKLLVDVTVPIKPPVTQVHLADSGSSAAQETQEILGPNVRVVSAFQNVSAVHLKELDHPVECDVLITGDDVASKDEVMRLAKAAGMRGIDAGPLINAVAAEALTPALLSINKRYGIKGAGIVITGLDQGG